MTMKTLFADFRHTEQGAVLPFVGLAFMVLVASVGIAVDYGRAQMVQSKLHAALDAAGLATASVAQARGNETRREALKFVEANFPQGYMNAHATENAIEGGSYVTYFRDSRDPQTSSVTIELQGAAKVDTIFMRLFGYDDVTVVAETVVSQTRRRGFEMVMALDSTGSMAGVQGGVTRRNAMVGAANEMLDILYGSQDSFDNIFIGLVPFSDQVRVGSAKRNSSNWLRVSSASVTPVGGPVACIDDGPEDRDVGYADTDTPPGTGNTLFVRQGEVTACTVNIPSEMLPMQTSKSRVRTALSQIRTVGTTRVDIGAVWAWRMLSPRWANRWNHVSAALPLAYNSPDMDKVVILLTDGENNPRGGTISRAQADTRLRNICTNMKHEGVIVYAITFHTTNMGVRNLMRGCATSDDHYFHASGNDSIGQVFRQIADSLMNLRISK